MEKRFGKYLLASLLIHLGVAVGIQSSSSWHQRITEAEPTAIPIEWLDLMEQPAPKGQIVDQSEAGPEADTPVDTNFLGRRNQVVEKETKASATGKFQNKPSATSANQAAAQNSAEKTPPRRMESGGFFPSSRDAFREMAQKRLVDGPQSDLQSQTTDHLKDIAASSETHLNTREYIYYNYFSRIKERILQHWEPSIKRRITKLVYQGRYMASTGDRTTHLLITLNKNGQLVRVQVKSPSGLRDLDEEAIKAFEAAAPFPNPPQGLVESDGTIKLDWRFIIEA